MSCYKIFNNTINDTSRTYGRCSQPQDGETVQCCTVGDVCLSNGICQYTHPNQNFPGGTGYYMAGCSDPTYRDSNCPSVCGNQGVPDVAYDFVGASWGCCGEDDQQTRLCSTPAGNYFDAPAPGDLVSLDRVVSTNLFSAFTTSTPAAAAPATTGSSTSSTPITTLDPQPPIPPLSNPSPRNLSAGAVVGITVGVLAVLAFHILCFVIRRRIRRSRIALYQRSSYDPAYVTQFEQRIPLPKAELSGEASVVADGRSLRADELKSESSGRDYDKGNMSQYLRHELP